MGPSKVICANSNDGSDFRDLWFPDTRTNSLAMTAVEVLDNAKEFVRVSGIASSRIAAIETELAQITSDGPIVLQIQDAIKSVKTEQTSSSLNSLQDAFAKLNKLYDINRSELKRSKFLVH